MTRVGITFNKDHRLHDPLFNGFPCPENPSRLNLIMEYIHESGLMNDPRFHLYEPGKVSLQDILRVHTDEYVEHVKELVRQPRLNPGNDVYLCSFSCKVLLQALGCTLKAGELVVTGKCDNSFAMIRPPGHHAESGNSSGFCVFNNSGILARYLQEVHGIERIAIVNIDAHASDGTCELFEADPDVLCISVHQDQSTLYPYKGFIRDIGVRPALGYCINMEMPTESGNPEYGIFYDEVLEKVLMQFDPQVVLLECGFDAYYKEPLTSLNLTIDGYHRIIYKLSSKWSVVTLLEGGYHEDLGILASVVLHALAGDDSIPDDVDQITLLASRHIKTRKEFDDNLALLKMRLEPYWDL